MKLYLADDDGNVIETWDNMEKFDRSKMIAQMYVGQMVLNEIARHQRTLARTELYSKLTHLVGESPNGLCPICGVTVHIIDVTKDGRLVGSCQDAFTVERWVSEE